MSEPKPMPDISKEHARELIEGPRPPTYEPPKSEKIGGYCGEGTTYKGERHGFW